ncbi:AAA family ATPase [Microbacterium sp. NPDC096154]|uniref:AAA family ATPase n=1 Tax=Microbacterium sp. NPDC096154 TaxID=3155549 RepID=UPI0033269D23
MTAREKPVPVVPDTDGLLPEAEQKAMEYARIRDERTLFYRADREARALVDKETELEAEWAGLQRGLTPDDASGGFRLMTLSKLRARPKPAWLIDGLIAQSSVCVIGGVTNVGKTFVSVDLTAHIALGKEWEGRNVVQGRVAYLIAEGAEWFPDRVAAWEQHNGHAVPESEYLVHDGQGFLLLDPAAVADMCVTVARNEIDVVVIDTLSQLGGLTNENDNSQMAAAVKAAVRIRRARPGCTVIIVHHANAQGLLRGAKALWADVDTVLMVAAAKGAKGTTPEGTFALSTEYDRGGKQRNAAQVTIPGWHLEDVGPSKVAVRLAMPHDPYQERILAVLADGEWHGAADFKKDWDDPSGAWSQRRYRTAMSKLAGLIEEQGETRNKQYRRKEVA